MNIADDLIAQATHLANLEKQGKPKQASLRRAVSAAYYSLYHRVPAYGAERLVTSARLRLAIARAFDHDSLAKTAQQIVGIHTKQKTNAKQDLWLARHVTLPVSDRLAQFCSVFAELQRQRHLADYDLAHPFTRSSAHSLIGRATLAHQAWGHERKTDNALVFILASTKLLRDR